MYVLGQMNTDGFGLLIFIVIGIIALIGFCIITFTSSAIGVITSYVKKEKREPLFKSPIIPILLVIDFLIILVIVLLLFK